MIPIIRIKDYLKISPRINRHIKCTIAFSKFKYVEDYFVPNRKFLDIKKKINSALNFIDKFCIKFQDKVYN